MKTYSVSYYLWSTNKSISYEVKAENRRMALKEIRDKEGLRNKLRIVDKDYWYGTEYFTYKMDKSCFMFELNLI